MTTTFTVGLRETCDGGVCGHVTNERAASEIVTTDDVLTECLTFFAVAPEQFRRRAADGVEGFADELRCSGYRAEPGVVSRAGGR